MISNFHTHTYLCKHATGDILDYLERAKQELDDIEFADDHLERLKGKLKKAEKEAAKAENMSKKEARKTLSKSTKKTKKVCKTKINMIQLQMSLINYEQ